MLYYSVLFSRRTKSENLCVGWETGFGCLVQNGGGWEKTTGCFYGRGMIELGRVTNAQCDRSVPSGTGGAESARGRVLSARRHARALGAPPDLRGSSLRVWSVPAVYLGQWDPAHCPRFLQPPLAQTPLPPTTSGIHPYANETGYYMRTSLVENPRFLGDKIKDKN